MLKEDEILTRVSSQGVTWQYCA